MDFKMMTDSELAKIMVSYIGRIENLLDIMGRYLEGNDNIPAEKIKRTYANLKEELRKDAHYLGLERNCDGSSLYRGVFMPSIREAAVFGFDVPINNDCSITKNEPKSIENTEFSYQK